MWTLERAQHLAWYLRSTFEDNGYLFTLHGSVLKEGYGRDLDLIAVPMFGSEIPKEHKLIAALGGIERLQLKSKQDVLGSRGKIKRTYLDKHFSDSNNEALIDLIVV